MDSDKQDLDALLKARIENLFEIVRLQKAQIDRLHTAVEGHQQILAALLPAAIKDVETIERRRQKWQWN